MRARVLLAVAATLCALTVCTSAFAQVAPPRNILVIHSGAESFPSNPILDAGIREALVSRSDVTIDYFAEYLESDLFPGEQAVSVFKDYLRRKYQDRRIDLVIAMTDTSLRFVLDNRAELFPEAPIVFFGLAAPDEIARRAGGGITGITVGVAYAETLKLALSLHPLTRRVFVVAKGEDQRATESVRAEFNSFSQRVNITYLTEETVPGLLSAIKAVPAESVILYIWHSQPDPGNVLYSDAVARLVANAATVPVYGTSDLYIGSGIVGGVMRRTRETGARLGELALRILSGTRPQDIPIETARVVPVIDWRQMRRWAIAGSRLPAGAQILFREPTVWERYKVYIVAGLAALLAQSALIAGLFIQSARRRVAEQKVHRSQEALRTSYERIRDLGSRLLNAQERERSRIARELHDDVSQQLAVLKMDLALWGRTVPGNADTMAADAMKRVEGIAVSVHDLSHSLHPARLGLLSLVEVLHALQAEMSGPDMTITFTHEHVPSAIPKDLSLCLYRVVQEALLNARKHSKARNVSVQLNGASDEITLTIVDDGVGFDVDVAWHQGLGLIGIHERAQAVGGEVDIRSRPGAGTMLKIRVPARISQGTEAVAVKVRPARV